MSYILDEKLVTKDVLPTLKQVPWWARDTITKEKARLIVDQNRLSMETYHARVTYE